MDDFIKQLMKEAVPELRRAGEDLAQRNVIDALSDAYENAPAYTPPPDIVRKFCVETTKWFNSIPVPVKWESCCGQPFATAGQMRRFVDTNQYLPMYTSQSIMCDTYHKHRAVHDWYGHIVPNYPFGPIGELAAYRIHSKMYSKDVLPLVFSDVVLSNCYFEMNGQFFSSEKYVKFDDITVASHQGIRRAK